MFSCKPSAELICRIVLAIGLLLSVAPSGAVESALLVDDDGVTHQVLPASSRVVALGPNLVEVIYELGAGGQLVGVSAFANFPAEAKVLPRVAAHNSVNYEMISALEPDLVVVWKTGFGELVIDKLRSLGFKVYASEPETLEDIAGLMESLGAVVGHAESGAKSASVFRERVQKLASTYSQQEAVSVFYQVWGEPMQTLNGDHVVSAVIELCGGKNIFAELPMKAPRIGVEAVVAANPDVIMASGPDGVRPEWLDDWRQWQHLKAVRNDQLVFVDPDILVRHAPRILEGAGEVCRVLDGARQQSSVTAVDGLARRAR